VAGMMMKRRRRENGRILLPQHSVSGTCLTALPVCTAAVRQHCRSPHRGAL
jgi:hypothetical protein